MSKHHATVKWTNSSQSFGDGKYSRVHSWQFDGGSMITASAAPSVVSPPYSSAEAVDPEEAFVASASSCHMLWFLDFAWRAGFVVQEYMDHAVGHMEKDPDGKLCVARIDLFPVTTWKGAKPKLHVLEKLHHEAHDNCYIANSVRCEIIVNLPNDLP
jgi:organic hydroperoxide reductase OsmC/OhrA